MKKISIIGSCVTRDAFELHKDLFDVSGSYFPRVSLISMMSPAINIDHTILVSENQWLKWVILNDYNKSIFPQIVQKKPETIIIDLIEERYDLIKVGNSFITRSDEQIKINPSIKKYPEEMIVRRDSDLAQKLFESNANLFCNKINTLFPDIKIVLHNARYSDYYISNGKIFRFDDFKCTQNKKYNFRLDYYLSILSGNINNSFVISIDKELSIANSNHKWGLSPFHYIDEYYEEFIKKLQLIAV